MEPRKIDTILDGLKTYATPRVVTRIKYIPYDMDLALKVIEALGRKLNAKFVIDQDNEFLYKNLIHWVHGDDSFMCHDPKAEMGTAKKIKGNLTAGIYISGPTGTGKTWALEILSEYTRIDGVKFRSGGLYQSLHFSSYRTDRICEEYSSEVPVDRFKHMPIVCFHDLGAEQKESICMGNRLQVMRSILDSRGDRNDLITLITSNIPFMHQVFREQYGDTVMSRMYEMCNYFELNGKDRRK